MKMSKLLLLSIIIICFSLNVQASFGNITSFYTNTSASFVSLSYVQDTGVNYLLAREGTTNKVWYFVNTATGTSPSQRTLYNGVNYNLYKYGSYIYLTRYNGSVGASIIERYNMSYTNATQIIATGYTTNTGGDRFQTFIGKYYYKLTGSSSNYLRVYDATNGSILRTDAYTFSFNKAYTDCNGLQIIPLGYDYDNDRLYFSCNTSDLVYIEEDFYLTNILYNNVELNESLIDSLTLPVSIDSQAYYKFVIINSSIFFINQSNTSQILSSIYTDEYEGLTCYTNPNTNNTECVNPYSFCMHPLFSNTPTSKSMCTNTTFTSQLNLISPSYDSPVNMYCNSDEDLTYCSNGCTNELTSNLYGISYYEANCQVDNTCTNECFIVGERLDSGITSYSVCETSTENNCLVINEYECDEGEYSQGGICVPFNNSGSMTEEKTFRVYPYTELYYLNSQTNLSDCPDVNCSYDENGFWTCPVNTCRLNNYRNPNLKSVNYNENTRTLDVTTCNDVGGIGLFNLALSIHGADADNFVGVDCDYKSNTEYYTPTNLTQTTLYSGELITGNKSFSSINVDYYNYERVSFAINNSDTIFKIIISDGANIISDLYIIINVSNSEYVVRQNNATGTILYTDTYTNPTVTRAVIDFFQDANNGIQNNQITLYNQLGTQTYFSKGINTQLYDDVSAGLPYVITIQSVTSNVVLQQIIREKIMSDLPVLYKQIYSNGYTDFVNNYELIGCTYQADGTFKARVFVSDNVKSNFFDFVDLTINKQTVNCGSIITPTETSLFDRLTKTQKLIWGFILSAIVFMFFVVFGLMQNDDSVRKAFIWVGFFLFIASIIVLTILEWIPVWVLIVAGIIASMGVAVFFVNKSNGG